MMGILTEIITALISGAVSGFTGYKLGTENKEEEIEEAEEVATRSAKSLRSDEAGSRFGWKAERVVSRMDVVNEEGDSVVRRSWRNIQPSEGVELSHLGGTFWVGTPGGQISSSPELSILGDFPKNAHLNYVMENDQRCRYNIDIAGSLTGDDPPLDYEIQIEYSNNVLMDEKEIQEAYKDDIFKNDYFVFDVHTPVDELVLEANFPRTVETDMYCGVFYGDSEIQNKQENKRIRDGFETTPTGARLRVANPLLGFRYFIYWTAPSISHSNPS